MKITFLSMLICLLILSFYETGCTKASEDKLAAKQDSIAVCDTVNMHYNADVIPILSANCYSCHGNGNQDGGITLDNYTSIKSLADGGVITGAITHAPGLHQCLTMSRCYLLATSTRSCHGLTMAHKTIKLLKSFFMKIIPGFLLLFFSINASAQLYMTRSATVNFFSETSLENIRAVNNQVYAIIDVGKKNIAFSMLLKSFLFEKELMQEHFNENYVESDKYPKATFSGSYTGDVDLTKNGVYTIALKGTLTLHNVSKQIEQTAVLEVKDKHVIGRAQLLIKPEDYNITIPSIVREKIAANVTVQINADCSFFK